MKKPTEAGRTAYSLTLKTWNGSQLKADGEANDLVVAVLARIAYLIQTGQFNASHPAFALLTLPVPSNDTQSTL